jgi:hypothetical protein
MTWTENFIKIKINCQYLNLILLCFSEYTSLLFTDLQIVPTYIAN